MHITFALVFSLAALESSFVFAIPGRGGGGGSKDTKGKGKGKGDETKLSGFDCSGAPENCANMCYAALCDGAPGVALGGQYDDQILDYIKPLHYDAKNNAKHREQSGQKYLGGKSTRSNNIQKKLDPFRGTAQDVSIDEWPPASTKEGGRGASLRLVPEKEQNKQGGQTPTYPAYITVLQNWETIQECIDLANGDTSVCRNNQRQFTFVEKTKELVQN